MSSSVGRRSIGKQSDATSNSDDELDKKIRDPLSFKMGRNDDAEDHRDQWPNLNFLASFDTISDPGVYPPEGHRTFPRTGDPLAISTPQVPAVMVRTNTRADISIPDLGHDLESDFNSLGDVSPIKLIYSPQNKQGIHHDSVEVRPSPRPTVHFPEGPAWEHSSTYHYGWTGYSNPFFVIRSSRRAFDGCKYVLPFLSNADMCSVHLSDYGHFRRYRPHEETLSRPLDLIIATRRVEAAVCAFGGSLSFATNNPQQTSSIFRLLKPKNEEAREEYRQKLPSRYFLSGSQISWEVEEEPPVTLTTFHLDRPNTEPNSILASAQHNEPVSSTQYESPDSDAQSHPNSPDQRADASKLKYRCKRCGQLKQNHICPFRQSLQRSIGVMVYPAVNSFCAAEPGKIAPALTLMNNFVSYDSEQGSPAPAQSNFRSHGLEEGMLARSHQSIVTPESLRTHGITFSSPQSSLSAHSDDAPASNGPGPPPHSVVNNAPLVPAKKRSLQEVLGASNQEHVPRPGPFVAPAPLRPEQYRAVTAGRDDDGHSRGFRYPIIPLTFAERKRFSDTLFHLCKSIPGMTGECAMILREARKNNEWDQGVAELMAQVVVGLYCAEGDFLLDGLQKYLLSMGISC